MTASTKKRFSIHLPSDPPQTSCGAWDMQLRLKGYKNLMLSDYKQSARDRDYASQCASSWDSSAHKFIGRSSSYLLYLWTIAGHITSSGDIRITPACHHKTGMFSKIIYTRRCSISFGHLLHCRSWNMVELFEICVRPMRIVFTTQTKIKSSWIIFV